MTSITVAGMEELGGHSCLFCFTRRLSPFISRRWTGDKAVEAVKQYKFKPAMENGKPVAVYLNVEVNFNIF